MTNLDWMIQDKAACTNHRNLFARTFSHVREHNTDREAKQICASCPLLEPCREYAFAATVGSDVGKSGPRGGQSRLYGVWGGTSYEERGRILRNTAA